MADERIVATLSTGESITGWLVADEVYEPEVTKKLAGGKSKVRFRPHWSEGRVLLDNAMGFCDEGAYTQSAIGTKLLSLEPAARQIFADKRLPDPPPDREFLDAARKCLLAPSRK